MNPGDEIIHLIRTAGSPQMILNRYFLQDTNPRHIHNDFSRLRVENQKIPRKQRPPPKEPPLQNGPYSPNTSAAAASANSLIRAAASAPGASATLRPPPRNAGLSPDDPGTPDEYNPASGCTHFCFTCLG